MKLIGHTVAGDAIVEVNRGTLELMRAVARIGAEIPEENPAPVEPGRAGSRTKLAKGDRIEIEGGGTGTVLAIHGDMATISWDNPPAAEFSLDLLTKQSDSVPAKPERLGGDASPHRVKKQKTSGARRAGKVKRSPKTCDICGSSFADKSRTQSRKVCYNKKCKLEMRRRTRREWYAKRHGAAGKLATPRGRAALIADSVRRLATDPRPSENGRVLPLIDPAREDG